MRSEIQKPARALTVALAVLVAVSLSGCVPNRGTGSSGLKTIAVASSETACRTSAATVPSGPAVFTVTNTADTATEFYLLAEDGLRIVGELENIAPGAPRSLTLQLSPGKYFTVCKPGMVGTGIGKTAFAVTDSGVEVVVSGTRDQQTSTAAKNYVAYVRDQVAQLIPATEQFLAAFVAGDVATARTLYPQARAHYERIEPVAESFGTIDAALDMRESGLSEGEAWTGWHLIEKDLWPRGDYRAMTPDQRKTAASGLTTATAALNTAVGAGNYTVSIDAISNGAIALLDEVASGKITGEEETFSHTDLWDVQANVEGARVAYEGVRDIVRGKNAALVETLDRRFDELEARVAVHGNLTDGFTYYDKLTAEQIKALADAVNALGEPLSRLTGALVR